MSKGIDEIKQNLTDQEKEIQNLTAENHSLKSTLVEDENLLAELKKEIIGYKTSAKIDILFTKMDSQIEKKKGLFSKLKDAFKKGGYFEKYLKYKEKYLSLKNQNAGGPPYTYLYVLDASSASNGPLYTALTTFYASRGAIPVTKIDLLNHLESIDRCNVKNDRGEIVYVSSFFGPDKKMLSNFCTYIKASSNIIGIRDSIMDGTFSYAFFAIDFSRAVSNSELYIEWAISASDTPGKGKALIQFANDLARHLGLPNIALAHTPDSIGYWEHIGFTCTRISEPGRPGIFTGTCTKAVV